MTCVGEYQRLGKGRWTWSDGFSFRLFNCLLQLSHIASDSLLTTTCEFVILQISTESAINLDRDESVVFQRSTIKCEFELVSHSNWKGTTLLDLNLVIRLNWTSYLMLRRHQTSDKKTIPLLTLFYQIFTSHFFLFGLFCLHFLWILCACVLKFGHFSCFMSFALQWQ